ncbi:unnamed protein product [Strongylus vulgaris]|uniref:Uncharacterized protein n=1 Tax=Strongylus vulgaris TaxID=40348 RepID=A0A3P7J1Q3_STRVU|nr:unnamed protein product [Strongylus vulgaris]
MITLKKRPLLSIPKPAKTGSDSESEDDEHKRSALPAAPKDFKIPWRKEPKPNSTDFFVLDTSGGAEETATELSSSTLEMQEPNVSYEENSPVVVDERVQKLLDKAVCGPSFEKNYAETANLIGRRAAKRLRKVIF